MVETTRASTATRMLVKSIRMMSKPMFMTMVRMMLRMALATMF